MFEHLAATLTPMGVAVLSFDRRPSTDGSDTPFTVQTDDALSAVTSLQRLLDAPVGLFGFSQGAWAASLAAARDQTVPFLAVVGCSGVTPAEQMRFYTDELLRRAGYGGVDREHLRRLRLGVEDLLRGHGDHPAAAALLGSALDKPWFDLAFLDRELPAPGDTWHDMDYDPEPALAEIICPALVVYGEDEECVPRVASEQAWLKAAQSSGNTTVRIVRLPECGHFPAPGADAACPDLPVSAFSPAYTAALQGWFSDLR